MVLLSRVILDKFAILSLRVNGSGPSRLCMWCAQLLRLLDFSALCYIHKCNYSFMMRTEKLILYICCDMLFYCTVSLYLLDIGLVLVFLFIYL